MSDDTIQQRLSALEREMAAWRTGSAGAPTAADQPRRTLPRRAALSLAGVGAAGLAAAGALRLSTTAAHASANGAVVNYQGRLTNAKGAPITQNLSMTFSLYTQQTGSTPVWSEAHTALAAVPVKNGLFGVYLGSITPLSSDLLAQPLYLGVQVGADTEMTPRQLLGTVPYALRSAQADHATLADSATNAQNAVNATNAVNAQNAVNATSATTATNATNATNAVTAQSATTAATATNALALQGNYPILGADVAAGAVSSKFVWLNPQVNLMTANFTTPGSNPGAITLSAHVPGIPASAALLVQLHILDGRQTVSEIYVGNGSSGWTTPGGGNGLGQCSLPFAAYNKNAGLVGIGPSGILAYNVYVGGSGGGTVTVSVDLHGYIY